MTAAMTRAAIPPSTLPEPFWKEETLGEAALPLPVPEADDPLPDVPEPDPEEEVAPVEPDRVAVAEPVAEEVEFPDEEADVELVDCGLQDRS